MREKYWNIKQIGKIPKLKNAVFIEGLPGIGNVGKVAVDFLIDELKAKKLYESIGFKVIIENEQSFIMRHEKT